MKAIDYMREELARVNLEYFAPVELRRRMVRLAKRAMRQGLNPRPYLSAMVRQARRVHYSGKIVAAP